jgi:hypothetical protein
VALNCKPNDIAIIVRTDPGMTALLGKVVQVDRTMEYRSKTCWWLKEHIPVVLPVTAQQNGKLYEAGRTVKIGAVPDDWLRPLRDSDGQDEVLRDTSKPCEVTA